ncbi:FRIGIDA-like protein [Actinidia chinensis var. chinensis]|uniref:FRIGIDA-like protein n=1 Tax=Actinidia chinensis var. chinensis TaxID=1590841 RepID=A0A2R6RL11_ACTCC|nr:FRIGIDA-like protein [Actinidia chinensis var. chinensis]
MADKDQSMGVETTSLIEQLGKAILELESLKDAAENDVQWSEIEEYFQHLETMMKKKTEELELREKEFNEKKSNTRTFLAEREAAVAAKEQDLLDRIQELKDAAVAAISGARVVHQPEPLEPINGGDDKETKVSSSLGDTNALLDASEENSPNKTDENAEGVGDEVKPRPELTQFCEQMDAKGLLNYTMENQKNIQSICVELSIALESATEPGILVLASLEGFYPPNDTTQEGDKSDAVLWGMRRSCIMFMEALATLLARADSGADHLINPEIKQQAKAIADEWKPKLADAGFNAANGNSLEAEAFLQLLVTFKIASEFDDEELCKIVFAVAHQRQAPELCRSLGLTHKMPAFVEELVKSGRQVDAVNFIHAFELTESFPPVPLLKTHLKDLRRNSQGKPGGGAAGAHNDANAQELAALRAVIRCVREYKLEADYPLDPLHKRVVQLEKSKPDKRRSGESGKHQQHKKPRANGGIFGFRAPPPAALPPGPAAVGGRQGPPVYGARPVYGGLSERYSLSGPTAYDYQTPSQTIYDQRSYYYPQDERVTAAAYNAAAPSSYGSYADSGVQSSHQQYM